MPPRLSAGWFGNHRIFLLWPENRCLWANPGFWKVLLGHWKGASHVTHSCFWAGAPYPGLPPPRRAGPARRLPRGLTFLPPVSVPPFSRCLSQAPLVWPPSRIVDSSCRRWEGRSGTPRAVVAEGCLEAGQGLGLARPSEGRVLDRPISGGCPLAARWDCPRSGLCVGPGEAAQQGWPCRGASPIREGFVPI